MRPARCAARPPPTSPDSTGLAPPCAIDRPPPLIGAPPRYQLDPRELFGFGWAGRFLGGGELGWREVARVRHGQLSGRPLAELGGALRPRGDGVGGDAG